MAKKIAILGSTGSIGMNALRVIDSLGQGYEVTAITAHSNVELLAEQVRKYKPKYAAITEPARYNDLKAVCGGKTKLLAGPESLSQIASLDEVDIVLTAVVGAAGLPSALAAARKGKRLAVANKEPLVAAGELLMRAVRENSGEILPVDSEHSAIFQAMQAGSPDEVRRIILTASGGPFRRFTPEQIDNASREQALAHPTWNMGPKITVDSATMMNKALEVIEAHWLFGIDVSRIDVLIHPESIIHSLVEFVDGSVIAQMGQPDMCLPIQYALTYPKRVAGIAENLKLEEMGQLTFEKADIERFPALRLGYDAARTGGTATAVFNAANEAVVEEFLAGRIRFGSIVELIERCMSKHKVRHGGGLEEVLQADAWARDEVCSTAGKM